MYKLTWREFGRDRRIVTKSKGFRTSRALNKFINDLFVGGTLLEIIAIQ